MNALAHVAVSGDQKASARRGGSKSHQAGLVRANQRFRGEPLSASLNALLSYPGMLRAPPPQQQPAQQVSLERAPSCVMVPYLNQPSRPESPKWQQCARNAQVGLNPTRLHPLRMGLCCSNATAEPINKCSSLKCTQSRPSALPAGCLRTRAACPAYLRADVRAGRPTAAG